MLRQALFLVREIVINNLAVIGFADLSLLLLDFFQNVRKSTDKIAQSTHCKNQKTELSLPTLSRLK